MCRLIAESPNYFQGETVSYPDNKTKLFLIKSKLRINVFHKWRALESSRPLLRMIGTESISVNASVN